MSSEPKNPDNHPSTSPPVGGTTYYEPQQEPTVYKYVQPQQPTVVYTNAPPTTIAIPVGSGGFMNKTPQLATCCMCIPLRAGALILSFLMFVYYCYMGISNLLLVVRSSHIGRTQDTVATIGVVLATLFLCIAIAAAFGFVGICQERLDRVRMFVRLYYVSVCIWILLEVAGAILGSVVVNSYEHGDTVWILWVAIFMVCLCLQIYFGRALVSYQRVLQQRSETFDGTTPANGAYVTQDVAMV